ncbi:MAG: hypothetical protein ACI4DU_10365 [Lachnospiraceae bacterium]
MVELIALLQVLQSKPKVILPDPVIIQEYHIDKTMIWPGVGEIDPDDLPDDGTGRSGSEVIERDDDLTGPLVISADSHISTDESVESIPDSPVTQQYSDESVESDDSFVSFDVPEDSSFSQDNSGLNSQLTESVVTNDTTSVYQDVSEEYSESSESLVSSDSPEPISVSTDATEESSVSQDNSDSNSQQTDSASDSEITDCSESDYSVGFQVILFAVGFLGGCIATFALFKHMRSR